MWSGQPFSRAGLTVRQRGRHVDVVTAVHGGRIAAVVRPDHVPQASQRLRQQAGRLGEDRIVVGVVHQRDPRAQQSVAHFPGLPQPLGGVGNGHGLFKSLRQCHTGFHSSSSPHSDRSTSILRRLPPIKNRALRRLTAGASRARRIRSQARAPGVSPGALYPPPPAAAHRRMSCVVRKRSAFPERRQTRILVESAETRWEMRATTRDPAPDGP